MAVESVRRPATVSRDRFMVIVLGGISTLIGLFYIGVLGRYLYPKNTDEPAQKVSLSGDGVTDPNTKELLPFKTGVAGPFNHPTSPDGSVVVGVFGEKIDAGGPLTEDNIRVVEQTCTHLGCPVQWGQADNRFECPCHGSQFNRDLSVYHGPAADPLHEHHFTLGNGSITITGKV